MEAVKQLIRRAQKKDLTAFEQLVTIYQGRVYALAHKLEGNPTNAQDLAQEAFIRAYSALDSFRGDADFGTWLHRITVNVWLNSRRKQRVDDSVSLDAPIQTSEGSMPREVASWEYDPESIVVDSQMSELMQKSLDELSKEQKAVLLLREIEDLSYEEIAVTLNCSLGTVRSRLSRAKDALRKLVVERARVSGIHMNGLSAEERKKNYCKERGAAAREVQ